MREHHTVHDAEEVRRGQCPNVFSEGGCGTSCCCLTPEQVVAVDARLERERRRRARAA